jgi:hypothetical protein
MKKNCRISLIFQGFLRFFCAEFQKIGNSAIPRPWFLRLDSMLPYLVGANSFSILG